MAELKPCPFCAGEPDFIGKEVAGYNVQCKSCLSTGGWGDYCYQAEAAWNRRKPSPAQITDAMVEAAAREAYGAHFERYQKMMRRALGAALTKMGDAQ